MDKISVALSSTKDFCGGGGGGGIKDTSTKSRSPNKLFGSFSEEVVVVVLGEVTGVSSHSSSVNTKGGVLRPLAASSYSKGSKSNNFWQDMMMGDDDEDRVKCEM